MSALLLITAPALPLLLALLTLAGPGGRAAADRLLPLAAVPLVALAGLRPEVTTLPWLLLGTHLGTDHLSPAFLLSAGLVWTLAALFSRAYLPADAHRSRFDGFFLVTLAGQALVLIAQDAVTFYFGFAIMTFSAYGLIVHEGTAAARRAGRVYLTLAVIGEALLIGGLLWLTATAGNPTLQEARALVAAAPDRTIIVALLLAGFAVKAGLAPLHMWLPLAHSQAPTPASAVLSGALIKAGLLGWLAFTPVGEMTLPGPGAVILVLGVITALGAAIAGALQNRIKTVLAYSSISQMGLAAIAFGIALQWPGLATILIPGLGLFVLYHGLAKATLFFSTAIAATPARLLLHGVVAGILMGLPLTGGAAFKYFLKDIGPVLPATWAQGLDILLPITSAATTALLARYLYLSYYHSHPGPSRGVQAIWLIAAMLALLIPGFWVLTMWPALPASTLNTEALISALWPIALGFTIGLIGWAAATWLRIRPRVPEGDILAFLPRMSWQPALVRRLGSSLPSLNMPERWLVGFAYALQGAAHIYSTRLALLLMVMIGLLLAAVAWWGGG